MRLLKSNINVFIVSMFLSYSVNLYNDICAQDKHPYASYQPISLPKKFEIPGIENAAQITFTPDGNTLYVLTGGGTSEVIYYSHFENGKWSTAKKVGFLGEYRMENPSISPDGKKFFFTKIFSEGTQHTTDICVMHKTDTGWSEPEKLDTSINSLYFNGYPSCAGNGNLYFISSRDGSSQIYCSKFENSRFSVPKALDYTINKYNPSDVFISPDETYILFRIDNRPNSYQLFISFNEKGIWTKPQNLGPKINFNDYQGRPYVSPDGNYLFYASASVKNWISSQYQVDIKPILDSLRYNVEVSAFIGKDKTIELPTLITFNKRDVKVKFSETPLWLKPYVKNTGNENQVINKISIDGLKAGIYKSRVKLTSGDNPVKEYTYLVRLNVQDRRPALPVKDLKKGIKYEYYEDTSFSIIPDFTKMKPQKTGIANSIDLSVKNRDTLYAIVYDGYINIPQTSVYTFFLTSDDGSKFHIDDELCIDNDGLHGPVEKYEDCYLEKGLHKIKIEFIQGGMGAALGLSYEAREIGIKKKAFSSDELFH